MGGKSFLPVLVEKSVFDLRFLQPGESRSVPAPFLLSVRELHGDVVVAGSDGVVIAGDAALLHALKSGHASVPCVIVPAELAIPTDWQQLPAR